MQIATHSVDSVGTALGSHGPVQSRPALSSSVGTGLSACFCHEGSLCHFRKLCPWEPALLGLEEVVPHLSQTGS